MLTLDTRDSVISYQWRNVLSVNVYTEITHLVLRFCTYLIFPPNKLLLLILGLACSSLPLFLGVCSQSSSSKTVIIVLIMAAAALVLYFSINLLAKLIEKHICKWNITKLTVSSCLPSLTDVLWAAAVDLQRRRLRSSSRLRRIWTLAALTLVCGDGAVPGWVALVLVIWRIWCWGVGAKVQWVRMAV